MLISASYMLINALQMEGLTIHFSDLRKPFVDISIPMGEVMVHLPGLTIKLTLISYPFIGLNLPLVKNWFPIW